VSALDGVGRVGEALSLIERVTRQFAVPALFVSHQTDGGSRGSPGETARMSEGRNRHAAARTATVLADTPEAGSIPKPVPCPSTSRKELAEARGAARSSIFPRSGSPGGGGLVPSRLGRRRTRNYRRRFRAERSQIAFPGRVVDVDDAGRPASASRSMSASCCTPTSRPRPPADSPCAQGGLIGMRLQGSLPGRPAVIDRAR